MEKLAKYSTIIYASIWLLGFVLSYSFYSKFNIDIVEYLDFTEIFFGFFTNILELKYLGGALVLMLLYSSVFLIVFKGVRGLTSMLYILIVIEIILLIGGGVLFLIETLFDFSLSNSSLPFSLNYLFLILLFFFTLKLYDHYDIKPNNNFSKYIVKFNSLIVKNISWGLFVLIISYSLTAYSLGWSQKFVVANLKYNKTQIKEVSFSYHNVLVKSDSVTVFIGATRNNIFLYNRRTFETLIFEKNNISNLVYGRDE